MSRLSLFNSPLLLGFDHFERALDRVNKISSDGYPPYNIEQLGENALRITLAVAGFAMGDLGITIEDNQLVVRGKQADDPQRVYLHRGIAARQFQRSFVLAEGIEVRGARLDNGLLHVDLVRPEVESRVRTIQITVAWWRLPAAPSALRAARSRKPESAHRAQLKEFDEPERKNSTYVDERAGALRHAGHRLRQARGRQRRARLCRPCRRRHTDRVFANREVALVTVRQHDLEPLSVH